MNISARDLMNRDLPEHVAELLAEHDVTPGLLCLEITESGFMEDPAHAQKVLDRLAELGVKLSIDDYGTGYSSLSYIMKLPVQELKIDQSFISRMATDEEISTIVRSTIDLGHNLGLQVVAEGVEDAAVWNMLRSLGCDDAQGYFMSRPLAAVARSRTGFAPNDGQFSGRRPTVRAAERGAAVREIELQLESSRRDAHRRETAPVQRARAQRVQRRDVRARGISLVPGQREARITVVEIAHQRVARRLGEDRCRADRRHLGVALDHRLEQAFESEAVGAGTAIAVDEHLLRRHGEA